MLRLMKRQNQSTVCDNYLSLKRSGVVKTAPLFLGFLFVENHPVCMQILDNRFLFALHAK